MAVADRKLSEIVFLLREYYSKLWMEVAYFHILFAARRYASAEYALALCVCIFGNLSCTERNFKIFHHFCRGCDRKITCAVVF